MTDLRKAAQKLVDKWDNFHGSRNPSLFPTTKELIEALRQALAQPEQVLTAKVVVTGREWVGLTDEEVNALLWKLSLGAVDEDVRTIEAKLKEKNT